MGFSQLEKNKFVKIIDINIGDIVQTDINEYDEVIGTCKFINNNNVYDLYGIHVTGSHIVKDGIYWKFVRDLTNIKIKNQPSHVYSLITKNNKLFINEQLFRDHIEIGCSDYHFNSIIKYVNRNYTDFGNRTLIPGLSHNNFIKTQYSQDLLENINVGDKLLNNTTVLGKIIFKNIGETYKYKHLIATGRQMIFDNKQWISIQHHPDAKKINYNENFITLITSDNQMHMSGVACLDFEETSMPVNYLSYLNNF